MEKEANELIETIENYGYPTYKVGGYVRDKVLGRPVQDIDIATAATPNVIISLFPQAIPTGIQHGTVTIPFKGHLFEVTTFRAEKNYIDFRHPSGVEFIKNIEDDLARRDFTINAMAMDLSGQIMDPFNGQKDLALRRIRAVRNPFERLKEDPLRILRGIRFSAQLNFIVEELTWQAMRESSLYLLRISRERIRDEWRKTMISPNPLQGITLLGSPNLIPFDEWREIFKVSTQKDGIHAIPDYGDEALRWAAIFACGGKKDVSSLLKDWKFPKLLTQQIQSILSFVFRPLDNPIEMKKALVSLGVHKMEMIMKLKCSLKYGPIYSVEDLFSLNEEIPIRKVNELAIKGIDLIEEFGRKPGPWIGQNLLYLFEKVAYEGLPNDFFSLLEEIRKGNEYEKKDS